jgi:hypothetical protein
MLPAGKNITLFGITLGLTQPPVQLVAGLSGQGVKLTIHIILDPKVTGIIPPQEGQRSEWTAVKTIHTFTSYHTASCTMGTWSLFRR